MKSFLSERKCDTRTNFNLSAINRKNREKCKDATYTNWEPLVLWVIWNQVLILSIGYLLTLFTGHCKGNLYIMRWQNNKLRRNCNSDVILYLPKSKMLRRGSCENTFIVPVKLFPPKKHNQIKLTWGSHNIFMWFANLIQEKQWQVYVLLLHNLRRRKFSTKVRDPKLSGKVPVIPGFPSVQKRSMELQIKNYSLI